MITLFRRSSTSAAPSDTQICMKELLRSNDPTIIAFAQAMLQGEGIATFEMDVHMSILDGSLGILPRRLMVRDADLFVARIVLTDNNIPSGLPPGA
jgi:Putative prokaryotic signal transducing protein